MTDVTKPIGLRRTQPWGEDSRGIGWCVWAGPLLLSRTRGARLDWWSARRAGWDGVRAYCLTVLGVSLCWTGGSV